MEHLYDIYKTLIKKVNTSFTRYLMDEINWKSRLIAITGARGTGKTTLMLQRIVLSQKVENSLYASLDNVYFSRHSIIELADSLYKLGIRNLYLDEVHKYKNWSQEIKNIYDSYPNMNIVFSGSSLIDIYKGFGDLSRRVVPYFLNGLSFREYLNFEKGLNLKPLELKSILNHQVDPELETPLFYFKRYLEKGYYPFYKEDDYVVRLGGVINAVLETDIPKYMDMRPATIDKIKQLLQIIAENVPFKPNYVKIADMIGVSRNTLPDYFSLLEKAGLIVQLRDKTKGIRSLGKVRKIYLSNTNLSYALDGKDINIGTLRETFFINQLKVKHKVYSSGNGDFSSDDKTFEVGGKHKSQKQIKDLKNAYVVKDDIEYGMGNIIPLWHFGLIY